MILAIGQKLFLLNRKNIQLTESGAYIYQLAENLCEKAFVTKSADKIKSVLLATTPHMESEILPSIIVKLQKIYPSVVITTTTEVSNLKSMTTEADIVLAHELRNRPDFNQVKLATFKYGLFASKKYLLKNGTPKTLAQLSGHKIIQYRDVFPLPVNLAEKVQIVSTVSSIRSVMKLVEAGLGIGSLTQTKSHKIKGTVKILPKFTSEADTYYVSCRNSVSFMQDKLVKLLVDSLKTF